MNPSLGKLVIPKSGERYFYYDVELMNHYTSRSDSFTSPEKGPPMEYAGYTTSPTNPSDEVEFIEEDTTYVEGRVLSQKRKIPRSKVIPYQYVWVFVASADGRKPRTQRHYYVPPSTASAWERAESQRLIDAYRHPSAK